MNFGSAILAHRFSYYLRIIGHHQKVRLITQTVAKYYFEKVIIACLVRPKERTVVAATAMIFGED
jgi:hypothetical protein